MYNAPLDFKVPRCLSIGRTALLSTDGKNECLLLKECKFGPVAWTAVQARPGFNGFDGFRQARVTGSIGAEVSRRVLGQFQE